MATKAKHFKDTLQNSKKEAEKFNQMETIFQKDLTDYSKILQIDKDFLFYFQIWIMADHFFSNYKNWLKSNLQNTNWQPI